MNPETRTVTQVTDTPDSTQDAVQVAVGGLTVTSISATGVTNTMSYDALGRQICVLQGGPGAPRTVSSTTHYNDNGQGASAKETQELARHSTPTVTMNSYVRTREDRVRGVVEALGEVINIPSTSQQDPNSFFEQNDKMHKAL